ncbi:hypothetical protein ACVIHI_009071 [Bradyrhizobium sp. USDA 4524]|uniref:hypothetical protein n=1 Tax=unclassified Bradyrhizobium TaxID=2631580 RepID=UPI00209E0A1D|nr:MULTISPECIES: hypothetical protein [unclassified Bradyrhizobium]MCP1846150.1 hypothetical protein [Bradyrhizobium sp. USDA 4538]MCP1907215.1 hypothetical protein [Bradyrhizobium sp. USDA 4537]MCP1985691.1 hypothetical protein [Bradyrhizobium sp. USDA 4539]
MSDDPTQETGKITFVASHRPPLEDGEYSVTIVQTVKNSDPNPPKDAVFDEAYTNTRRFQVRGERFAVDAAEISSVFPPSSSTGEYANVLPHIVFSRVTLPWERSVGDAADSSWLALLLFDEDDPVPEPKSVFAGDLTPNPFPHAKGGPDQPSALPTGTVSYPGLTFDYGEFPYQPCNVIDVPVALFNQVVPGQVDMPWLAHARILTTDKPARMGLTTDPGTEVKTSVIVGNRLPNSNARCTVHLVSLEGMASLLPAGDDYTPAAIKSPNGGAADAVRLVTLANWSYQSVDPKQTFSELLKALDADDNLRVFAIADGSTGTGPADSFVANALHMGYTPLNHQTRQGSKTVSWYRGPLVPFAVPPDSIVPVPGDGTHSEPIATADEAVRYDPDNGMMDISYAAAWQIGRLLALQDQGFSQALYEWKRSNTLAVVTAFERQVLEREFGATLGVTAGRHSAEANLMHHLTSSFIRTRLKPHLMRGQARRNPPGEVQ